MDGNSKLANAIESYDNVTIYTIVPMQTAITIYDERNDSMCSGNRREHGDVIRLGGVCYGEIFF